MEHHILVRWVVNDWMSFYTVTWCQLFYCASTIEAKKKVKIVKKFCWNFMFSNQRLLYKLYMLWIFTLNQVTRKASYNGWLESQPTFHGLSLWTQLTPLQVYAMNIYTKPGNTKSILQRLIGEPTNIPRFVSEHNFYNTANRVVDKKVNQHWVWHYDSYPSIAHLSVLLMLQLRLQAFSWCRMQISAQSSDVVVRPWSLSLSASKIRAWGTGSRKHGICPLLSKSYHVKHLGQRSPDMGDRGYYAGGEGAPAAGPSPHWLPLGHSHPCNESCSQKEHARIGNTLEHMR
jgi:hypothetical protein